MIVMSGFAVLHYLRRLLSNRRWKHHTTDIATGLSTRIYPGTGALMVVGLVVEVVVVVEVMMMTTTTTDRFHYD